MHASTNREKTVKILVIEDHAGLAENLFGYFGSRGYTMDWASDGVMGLYLSTTQTFDVIILDLALPGIDGLELCHKLRYEERLNTPIIMLTARSSLDDRVVGLDAGADDYLVKPFELKELESRIRALVRRAQPDWPAAKLRVADLVLDVDTLVVTRAGRTLKLPPIPLRLLKFLMLKTHRVVSTAELEELIWGDDLPESGVLRTHLHTLRQAIDKPFDKPLLKTIPSVGYRLFDE